MKIYLIGLQKEDNSIIYLEVFLKKRRAEDYLRIHQDTDLCKIDSEKFGKLILKEKDLLDD